MLEISSEKVKLFNEKLLTSVWPYLVLHKDVKGWREGNYDYLTRFCVRKFPRPAGTSNSSRWLWIILSNGWGFKYSQHAKEFYMEFHSEL
jgi:hypothetical protein